MKSQTRIAIAVVFFVLPLAIVRGAVTEGSAVPKSHPPIRTLPNVSQRPPDAGPAFFVDAAHGDDASDGSKAKPWRTIAHALQLLNPGDTLCLRGGTFYETIHCSLTGTPDQPITIRSIPVNGRSSMAAFASSSIHPRLRGCRAKAARRASIAPRVRIETSPA